MKHRTFADSLFSGLSRNEVVRYVDRVRVVKLVSMCV